MTLTEAILRLLDSRSFSSPWYWIALAALWLTAGHWVLGVPYGMVIRARRRGGAEEQDFRDLLKLNVRRLSASTRRSGPLAAGAAGFALTVLGLLGFAHGIEFCQALFLILFPLSIVALLRLRMAAALAPILHAGPADAELLAQKISWHRFHVQLIGAVAITVTAFWGMLRNLGVPLLG